MSKKIESPEQGKKIESPEQGNEIENTAQRLEKELTAVKNRFEKVEKRSKYLILKTDIDTAAKKLDENDEFDTEPVTIVLNLDYGKKITIKNYFIVMKIFDSIKEELNMRIKNLETEILEM
jgi:NADH:ubiquinone oxidoreductase subunit C